MDKRRWVTYGLLGGVLVLAAWAASARPAPRTTLGSHDGADRGPPRPLPVVQIPKAPPRVELVFALDTTGSMGGLIDGAKRKIWSIAQFIANGQPKPDLRIGLVAYRDVGDEYVTRFYDLSGDLDEVFEHLSSFEAAGGGDDPEHVSKALHDAVFRTAWTAGQGTLKQIYLVGDAPPHTDYHDGYDYLAIARQAHAQGIHINTIRCGGDAATAMVWTRIADVAAGEYASIDQSGGVRVAATPWDAKLAELNGRLVDSTIRYGKDRIDAERRAHAAKALPAATAADRASFFGLKGDSADDQMLLRAGAVGGVPAAELPPEMAPMSAAEREAYVKQKAEERGRVQAEINQMAKKRNEWLKTRAAGKPDSFDAKVEGALKEQAKSIGLAL